MGAGAPGWVRVAETSMGRSTRFDRSPRPRDRGHRVSQARCPCAGRSARPAAQRPSASPFHRTLSTRYGDGRRGGIGSRPGGRHERRSGSGPSFMCRRADATPSTPGHHLRARRARAGTGRRQTFEGSSSNGCCTMTRPSTWRMVGSIRRASTSPARAAAHALHASGNRARASRLRRVGKMTVA